MRKIITIIAIFLTIGNIVNAQDSMYVYKDGLVTTKVAVLQIDSVIFYKATLASATITDYDGNVYKTVTIGSQVWMAENLKTTKYANGTTIPLINTNSKWDALTSTAKAYCWHSDNIANKVTYGALYTWTAAMDGEVSVTTNPSRVQGVCPTGWHLPSDGEWAQLSDYLGGTSVAGGKLKETGTTHWSTPNSGSTNEIGFTALPGGCRYEKGSFNIVGFSGSWWTATENDVTGAWYRILSYGNSNMNSFFNFKELGLSVRCVRD